MSDLDDLSEDGRKVKEKLDQVEENGGAILNFAVMEDDEEEVKN